MKRRRESPKTDYTKTSIKELRDEVLNLKIDPSVLVSMGKKLTPEEVTLLKVTLLQEREEFTKNLHKHNTEGSAAILKNFDLMFVKELLKSVIWKKMVEKYVQDKIQSQQGASQIASNSR